MQTEVIVVLQLVNRIIGLFVLPSVGFELLSGMERVMPIEPQLHLIKGILWGFLLVKIVESRKLEYTK